LFLTFYLTKYLVYINQFIGIYKYFYCQFRLRKHLTSSINYLNQSTEEENNEFQIEDDKQE